MNEVNYLNRPPPPFPLVKIKPSSSFAQNRTPDRVNQIQIAVLFHVADDAMCLPLKADVLEIGDISRHVLSLAMALVSAEQGAAVAGRGGGRLDLDRLHAGAAAGEVIWGLSVYLSMTMVESGESKKLTTVAVGQLVPDTVPRWTADLDGMLFRAEGLDGAVGGEPVEVPLVVLGLLGGVAGQVAVAVALDVLHRVDLRGEAVLEGEGLPLAGEELAEAAVSQHKGPPVLGHLLLLVVGEGIAEAVGEGGGVLIVQGAGGLFGLVVLDELAGGSTATADADDGHGKPAPAVAVRVGRPGQGVGLLDIDGVGGGVCAAEALGLGDGSAPALGPRLGEAVRHGAGQRERRFHFDDGWHGKPGRDGGVALDGDGERTRIHLGRRVGPDNDVPVVVTRCDGDGIARRLGDGECLAAGLACLAPFPVHGVDGLAIEPPTAQLAESVAVVLGAQGVEAVAFVVDFVLRRTVGIVRCLPRGEAVSERQRIGVVDVQTVVVGDFSAPR